MGKIITSCILIFLFVDRRLADTIWNLIFNEHIWTLM
jgi:hypothetical protein